MTNPKEKDVLVQRVEDLIKSYTGDVRYGDAPWHIPAARRFVKQFRHT